MNQKRKRWIKNNFVFYENFNKEDKDNFIKLLKKWNVREKEKHLFSLGYKLKGIYRAVTGTYYIHYKKPNMPVGLKIRMADDDHKRRSGGKEIITMKETTKLGAPYTMDEFKKDVDLFQKLLDKNIHKIMEKLRKKGLTNGK